MSIFSLNKFFIHFNSHLPAKQLVKRLLLILKTGNCLLKVLDQSISESFLKIMLNRDS